MGWLVRGMHRWGASVFIILMFLHMGRVFLFGAYKYPRELNWIIGVLILAMGMMEGFTGYLLPWDQTAYWASVVGINLNGTAPFLGPWLAQFLRGGQEISGDTLTRFYSLHMLLIPGAIIGAHRAAPLSRDPARRHLAAVVEGGRRGWSRRGSLNGNGRVGLTQPVARGTGGRRLVAASKEKPSPRRRAPRAGSRATRRTSRSAGSRSSRTRCSTTR